MSYIKSMSTLLASVQITVAFIAIFINLNINKLGDCKFQFQDTSSIGSKFKVLRQILRSF